MEQTISKCGYRCDLCPAYAPNIKSDADKQRMCDAWAKYFGSQIQPEEITACPGCLEGGGYPNCEVRDCANEKAVENCAHCELFECEKLRAKMNIIQEKVKDPSGIPEDDYNLFIKPFDAKKRLLKIREQLNSA